MPKVNVNGVEINYIVEGSGDEVIFFVHGLGESHETWVEQIKFFSDHGYKVVAIDLRGHGESSIPKEKIKVEDFAKDVISVTEDLGIDKINYCGYSMGAVVLLETYKVKPDVFKSLILEAATPYYPPAQTDLLENMSMDEIAKQVSEFAVGPNAPKELRDDIYRIISKMDKEVYIETAEAVTSKVYTDVLSTINVPTLLIAGDLDFIAPPDVAEDMKNSIKNAKLYVIKNVGHMPHREAPDEFNKIVKDFIDKIKG